MEDVVYLYEFKLIGFNLLNAKQYVQVQSDEYVDKPEELLIEQGLNPKDFLYIRLLKIVDNTYEVLYDINVS